MMQAYFGKQLPSLMKYANALFLSAVSLSERKVEFWKPIFLPPAILVKKLLTNSNFSDIESSGLTMYKRRAEDMMAPLFTMGLWGWLLWSITIS